MASKRPNDPVNSYLVVHTPLLHDGDLYLPGEAVDLTDSQAKRQGANVTPAPTDEPAA